MIGIDILALKDFTRQLTLGKEGFRERVYLPDELTRQDTEHLAGIFCAKEAVMKAVGLEPGSWQRIMIKHEASGKPVASVDGQEIPISIAHHGGYAVAVAVRLPS